MLTQSISRRKEGRKEGRRHDGVAVVAALIAAVSVDEARAQTITGTWEAGFHHEPPGSVGSTDFRSAFSANPGYVPPPADGQPFGWGFNSTWSTTNGNFNAIHMCLIPKGEHQGRVVVWNRGPVTLKPGTNWDPLNRYWMFQAWSIIDPTQTTLNAANPRFRNFLLPIDPFGASFPAPGPNPSSPTIFEDIFCTGHCWNQNGDLVVAGGAKFHWYIDPSPTPHEVLAETGAKFLFLFDPDRISQPFPNQPPASPLYPGQKGFWARDPLVELLVDRYYPTVTLSQRLTRLNQANPVEVAMVAGGTDPNSTGPLPPEDTYECWQTDVATALPPFTLDPDHGMPPVSHPGPMTSVPNHHDEWLDQYPRLHLLSDGTIFLSGWGYLSAKIDLNVPIAQRVWTTNVGRTGSGWPYERHDGSSVFFARVGPWQDLVARMCGDSSSGFTNNAEVCLAAAVAPAPWSPLGNVPGPARTHVNAVILPDASVVVIGGGGTAPNLLTAVYRNGWHTLPSPAGDSPTRRRYHATAILLPDGRVLVGGGENRPAGHDYDIFVPHYLQGNPQRPGIVSLSYNGSAVPQDPDGTWRLTNNQQSIVITFDGLEAIDHISRLVLMAPGAMTHHSDMSARYVELTFAPGDGAFDIPDNHTLPRGYYMLFALNSALVPSEAAWVRIL